MSFATALQGISPFGPIFGKELRTTARRKRTYFLRIIYLALLLIVLLFAFTATSNVSRYSGGVAAQNQARSELGQIFFACFAVFSVLIMGVLGPVMTATAISSERLHKTLGVLLMTPITAWQIIAGKLFSRLLVSLTLIGLGLPVLALVRLLGGVELEQVIGVIALALVAAISSAAIGLFYSTILNRAYAVILLSYGTMIFLYMFVPFCIAMTWEKVAPNNGGTGPETLICAINPYAMTSMVVEPRGWTRLGTHPWGWCIGIHVALTAGLMMWSAMILRRRTRREGEAGARAGNPDAGIPFAAPVPPPLIVGSSVGNPGVAGSVPPPLAYAARVPAVRKERPPRDVADNPILWRELRRPLMARRWQRVTGVCVCLFILLTVYFLIGIHDGLDESKLQSVFAVGFNFLIAGIILVLSSTVIAQEKESDTWTLLLASPVSGSTIVWGKAFGTARRLLWPMALVAAHFLLFACCQVISFGAAFAAIWIIISFNSIWIATGVYFSLRFNKTTFAVVANLMLAIAAYLLVLIAFGLASNIDNFHDPRDTYIDPKWVLFGIYVLFAVASGWVVLALFQSIYRARGALGHLMIASLMFIIALGIFAAKNDWVSGRYLYEQVGWYAPYYYLVQIGEHRHRVGFELPGGALSAYRDHIYGYSSSYRVGSPTTAARVSSAVVFGTGIVYLALSSFILMMTSWKFSGLVGRASQSRQLSAADRSPMHGPGPISTRLA